MISQTAEYALRAMVCLASSPERRLTTPQIAEVTRVPAGYLSKVLQALGRAGLADSQRGLGGGFLLGKRADQITVLEVIDSVDPIRRITACPLSIAGHQHKLCPLHSRLDQAIAQVQKAFGATTLAELLEEATSSKPFGERGDLIFGLCDTIPPPEQPAD